MLHPKFWITTSWDDGHPFDRRLADLLDRHGLTGTFYLARDYLPERLTDSDIRQLAAKHEIGAHTLSHPILTDIAPDAAREEIVGSRKWLQNLIGQPITAFCYPKGKYDSYVRRYVAEAGFTIARTVQSYRFWPGADPLTLPTTLQVYPMPLRPNGKEANWKARTERLRQTIPRLQTLHLSPLALRSWPALAIGLLRRAAELGGVWHLWGHSWEIDRYNLWTDLERVLAATESYAQAQRITNSQLVQLTHTLTQYHPN